MLGYQGEAPAPLGLVVWFRYTSRGSCDLQQYTSEGVTGQGYLVTGQVWVRMEPREAMEAGVSCSHGPLVSQDRNSNPSMLGGPQAAVISQE